MGTGLDKRIAATSLRFLSPSLRYQLIFWFLLSALLSSVLPNAVVCATITPIVISMLKYIGQPDIGKSRIASKLLLTIVYVAGLGGIASPLGGAMNLVTVDYIQQLTGQEYMYIDWVVRFLPITVALVVCNILFIIRDVKKDERIGGTKEYFLAEYQKLPKMSLEEKLSLMLFVIATVLAFTRQIYQTLLPGLKPAYVFITCAVISFLIVAKDGQRLMVWKKIQSKIVWEMIYIFAGGLAIGTLIKDSGAAESFGSLVAQMNLSGSIWTILVIITITTLLSDITSNTATAAITIPIVISIMQGIGENPLPFIYIASVGINLSYMLPTSIRAIPVGYGLSPQYLFKEGIKITLIVITLSTLICCVLYRYWQMFSTL